MPVEAAHARRARGRVRDRERRRRRRGGSAAADGVIFGQLGAEPEPKAFYRELERDAGFARRSRWDAIDSRASTRCSRRAATRRGCGSTSAASRCSEGRRVLGERASRSARSATACWCSRAASTATGKSVLAERARPACRSTWSAPPTSSRAWKLGPLLPDLPGVRRGRGARALARSGAQFERGPRTLTARGTATTTAPAFVVEDGRYVSARWPGDAYLFARRFGRQLSSRADDEHRSGSTRGSASSSASSATSCASASSTRRSSRRSGRLRGDGEARDRASVGPRKVALGSYMFQLEKAWSRS